MRRKNDDDRVALLLAAHGGEDAESVIAELCRELLTDASASIPVDLDVVASFRNARVKVCVQPHAETIAWNGRYWMIRISESDTRGRQRFSTAHAIVHTFFMDAERVAREPHGRQWSWSAAEEELCDLGAAELLLPASEFITTCSREPTMDEVVELAEVFDASAEATAIRAVTLARVPAAMVVLEPTFKPAELGAMARAQNAIPLPGFEAPPVPRKKLRVQKSLGLGVPFIPRWKSVADDSPLADVRATDTVAFVGETGLIAGTFRVSARRLPIRRDGVLVDRVVVLMFADRAQQRTARRTPA